MARISPSGSTLLLREFSENPTEEYGYCLELLPDQKIFSRTFAIRENGNFCLYEINHSERSHHLFLKVPSDQPESVQKSLYERLRRNAVMFTNTPLEDRTKYKSN